MWSRGLGVRVPSLTPIVNSALVAQLVEQLTLNQRVVGSSPSQSTITFFTNVQSRLKSPLPSGFSFCLYSMKVHPDANSRLIWIALWRRWRGMSDRRVLGKTLAAPTPPLRGAFRLPFAAAYGPSVPHFGAAPLARGAFLPFRRKMVSVRALPGGGDVPPVSTSPLGFGLASTSPPPIPHLSSRLTPAPRWGRPLCPSPGPHPVNVPLPCSMVIYCSYL